MLSERFLGCSWILDLFPDGCADALNKGLRLLVGHMSKPVAQQLQEFSHAAEPLCFQTFAHHLRIQNRSSFNVLPQEEAHIIYSALEFGEQIYIEVGGSILTPRILGLHGEPIKFIVNSREFGRQFFQMVYQLADIPRSAGLVLDFHYRVKASLYFYMVIRMQHALLFCWLPKTMTPKISEFSSQSGKVRPISRPQWEQLTCLPDKSACITGVPARSTPVP